MPKQATITVTTDARDLAKRWIIGTDYTLAEFATEALLEKIKRPVKKKKEAA